VILIEGSANGVVLVLKLVVGLTTGSIGILGDAVHSVTDVANNIVAWIVIRLSSRPADERHPYGHRKFETIAVFGLAMFLTILAFELGMRAIQREAPEIVHTGWALGLMVCVLAVNASLATWQASWARRLESDILRADSRHTFADVLTLRSLSAGNSDSRRRDRVGTGCPYRHSAFGPRSVGNPSRSIAWRREECDG
jgi:cation diffusion facilitator family transporter